MSWKSFAADYLSFSKKDRIALFLILLVAAGCYLLPFFLKSSEAVHVMEDSLLSRATDSLIDRSFASGPPLEEPAAFPEYRKKPAFTPGHRFPFDPNTLPPEAWARLG